MDRWSFISPEDHRMGEEFLASGYWVQATEDSAAATAIQALAAELAAKYLAVDIDDEPGHFLDTIHTRVSPDRLNELRLAVFNGMQEREWVRPALFATARRALEILVGNELAMQLRVNLSIQLPEDNSSLLPIHCDVWNGDSPYEVVVWLPLVDCRATKSMFILPAPADARWQRRLGQFAGRPAEELFRAVEPELEWLNVSFGQVVLFTQNVLHGNRVNRESSTRWSLNCRFKGVFTPYAEKRLGDFFEPVTLRPATRLGAAYALPGMTENE